MRSRQQRVAVVGRVLLPGYGALVALCFVAAWLRGRPDSPWINLYYLTPLLGGVLGLARLAARHPTKPDRSTVAYVVFCLALIAWGLSGVWYVAEYATHAGAVRFPSLGDVGYYAGGIAWAVGAWVLYEGVVPDFLAEVEATSYLLSILALATLFVLSVAGGADLVESIKTGGNPVQVVALSFPLLYGFSALMLFRLARRRQRTQLMAGQPAIKLIAGGLALVYAAQMALETTVTLAERATGTLPGVRNAQPPYFLYALAFLVLSVGVARYPLAVPVVGTRPPDPAPSEHVPGAGSG
jgi:hypothetical protein